MVGTPPAKKAFRPLRLSCVLLLAVLVVAALVSAIFSLPKSGDGPTTSKLAVSVAPQRDIQVQSEIVKQVGQHHRYFFDIRNKDKAVFDGAVTIELLGESGLLAKETFMTTRPLASGRGTSVYIEANTGPVSVHGAFGIKTFRFSVMEGNKEISSGAGPITESFEAL